MHAFDPNDYRKRVLAAVERRGGIETSDAFELYDIPLEEADRLTDVQVQARIDEVWGFWQKQRDHPKYRVLVGLLVDEHDDLSEPLLRASSRRVEADRVRQLRARRDSERYEMLDTAIERLVQRHGGIPAGKMPGLEDIGKMSGLTPDEIQARVRRHRLLDDEPATAAPAPAPGLDAGRRQQIRKLLAEYERLLPGEPCPTLLVLLGLDFTKAHQTHEIHLRAEALRSRTRELPPGRIRVVLDELLIHISDLLESGGSTVDDYLQAVVEDVTDVLRPQVRAAVLVEDHLVAADFDFLVTEAMAAGLDHPTAERVLIGLTDELGTTVEGREHLAGTGATGHIPGASGRAGHGGAATGGRAGSGTTGRGSAGGPASHGGASGRGGAAGHGGASGRGGAAGHSGGSPYGGRTPTGAGGSTGSAWNTSPSARAWEEPLKAARAALRAGHPREADRQVAEAKRKLGGDSAGMTAIRPVAEEVDRILAEAALRWRNANAGCAGKRYVEALEHLEYLQRTASDVPNPDVTGPTLQQLTNTARAELAKADQLLAAAPTAPAAARMRALRAVFEICADHAGAAAALAGLPVDAPGQVTARRQPDGTVLISWNPSPTENVEYRVTRLHPDGSGRVVGRTRTTTLEDGGATPGPLPVYGVVATVSGRTSEMSRTDQTPPPPAPATPPTTPSPTTSSPTSAAAPSATGRIDTTRPDRRAARAAAAAAAGEGPAATGFGSAATASVPQPAAAGSPATPLDTTARIDTTRPDRRAARAAAAAGEGSAATGFGSAATASPSQPATADSSPAAESAATKAAVPAAAGSPATAAADALPPAAPSGMPTVRNLAEHGGLLIFEWPTGITEVMVYARADAPPTAPDDPQARAWKVTNTRYQIDGGARVPGDVPRPCHLAVASCRRDPSGTLTVAAGFAPDSRIQWAH
ncbi:hypothetical protein H0264_31505 [Nocardia huaxiensis]|uniref:SaeA fourth Fn3-like domain-containing protein n=1 Tax=Nocardia huaxiensis TaxID=2755382 RepID=A0A7D6VDC8_9NOCA|nr:hypothetical protein [Nocardia huaxiensis]QLY29715.1 hypothetical protein H0264_31505 [Nocardia huaxiensis]